MRDKPVFIVCLIVSISVTALTVAGQNSFKGIVPMVTTKAEVEKKFGKRDEYGRYDFQEGMVRIHYRDSECDASGIKCLCLVAIGTVLEVSIWPSSELRIEDLRLDTKEWESGELKEHVKGIIFYSNRKTGVTYYSQKGIVDQIIYGVSEETCKKLSKKANPTKTKYE